MADNISTIDLNKHINDLYERALNGNIDFPIKINGWFHFKGDQAPQGAKPIFKADLECTGSKNNLEEDLKKAFNEFLDQGLKSFFLQGDQKWVEWLEENNVPFIVTTNNFDFGVGFSATGSPKVEINYSTQGAEYCKNYKDIEELKLEVERTKINM